MTLAPSYRAGINLTTTAGLAEIIALLRDDPDALAAARAEMTALADENGLSITMGHGEMFDRCHVSKVVHDQLAAALQEVDT